VCRALAPSLSGRFVENVRYGISYSHIFKAEDAKKAVEHLNGFELAGRPMRVVEEIDQDDASGPSLLNQR